MLEIGLKYTGKTHPLILKNPELRDTLTFVNNRDVVWVKKVDYQWLFAHNPRMFEVTGERSVKKKDDAPAESVTKENIGIDGQPIFNPGSIPEVVETKETWTSKPTASIKPPKKRGMPKGGWPKKEKDNGHRE